jgi:hypothetical protein
MVKAPKRKGRPPEFSNRTRLVVLLEADELLAVQERAATEDISASAFARRVVVRATQPRPRRRAK